jgi:hypothetical protein
VLGVFVGPFRVHRRNHAVGSCISISMRMFHAAGGVLDIKKMGMALLRTGELFSGVEKWVSGSH